MLRQLFVSLFFVRSYLETLKLRPALQAKLDSARSGCHHRFGIGGLKAALDLKGYVGGAVRAPCAPTAEAREEIRRCLEQAESELQSCNRSETAIV